MAASPVCSPRPYPRRGSTATLAPTAALSRAVPRPAVDDDHLADTLSPLRLRVVTELGFKSPE
jgi:hypothetical protein